MHSNDALVDKLACCYRSDAVLYLLQCSNLLMTTSKSSVERRKRIRLTPEVRSDKILESALVEFSQNGFASTRIEDIARGAGLSKSGFYGHFQNKEEVFEVLLTRFLITDQVIPFGAEDTVDVFIERFLDFCYSYLADVRRHAVLRLLLTEAHRVPNLISEWHRSVADPIMNAQIKVLQAAFERGQLANALTLEDYFFAYSPLLYWVLANNPHTKELPSSARDLSRHRERHRQVMLTMLTGVSTANTASAAINPEDRAP